VEKPSSLRARLQVAKKSFPLLTQRKVGFSKTTRDGLNSLCNLGMGLLKLFNLARNISNNVHFGNIIFLACTV
jgi:hypothetical protein